MVLIFSPLAICPTALHLLLLMRFGPPVLISSDRIHLPISYKNSTKFLGSINPSLVDKIMNKFQ